MHARRGIFAALATCAALLATALGSAEARAGEWLAGDLHVHTTYSHDSYGGPGDDNTGPDEAFTLGNSVAGQFAIAQSRGLDFLAITDHNDLRSQSDPGWPAPGAPVFGVPGYENSLDGHAQMLGATRLIGSGTSATEVQAAADELRAPPFNGAFQINHPAEGTTGTELDWKLDHQVVPDTVEVWNISRLYQPPAPSASDNDAAVRFWEGFLDAGERVAATGGSDNHYLATTAIQGAGQPTTWVYADDRSAAGVLRGLRAGHTFVSYEPPDLGGPSLFLEADGDRDGKFESIAGDAVPPSAAMRVRVEGAPGAMLRLVGTGGEELSGPVPVTGPAFEHRFELPAGLSWVRAEIFSPDGSAERAAACDDILGDGTTYCRNALGVMALSSAIFVREPAAQPACKGKGHRPGRRGKRCKGKA
jgi:hypothetical protein